MARNRTTEQMRLYQRGRRARIRAAKDVLSQSVRSGITVTKETRDGVPGLYASAKFTQAQLDTLEELAQGEHTDAETMVEDMLHETMLAWRRERNAKLAKLAKLAN